MKKILFFALLPITILGSNSEEPSSPHTPQDQISSAWKPAPELSPENDENQKWLNWIQHLIQCQQSTAVWHNDNKSCAELEKNRRLFQSIDTDEANENQASTSKLQESNQQNENTSSSSSSTFNFALNTEDLTEPIVQLPSNENLPENTEAYENTLNNTSSSSTFNFALNAANPLQQNTEQLIFNENLFENTEADESVLTGSSSSSVFNDMSYAASFFESISQADTPPTLTYRRNANPNARRHSNNGARRVLTFENLQNNNIKMTL